MARPSRLPILLFTTLLAFSPGAHHCVGVGHQMRDPVLWHGQVAWPGAAPPCGCTERTQGSSRSADWRHQLSHPSSSIAVQGHCPSQVAQVRPGPPASSSPVDSRSACPLCAPGTLRQATFPPTVTLIRFPRTRTLPCRGQAWAVPLHRAAHPERHPAGPRGDGLVWRNPHPSAGGPHSRYVPLVVVQPSY